MTKLFQLHRNGNGKGAALKLYDLIVGCIDPGNLFFRSDHLKHLAEMGSFFGKVKFILNSRNIAKHISLS